MKSSPGRKHLFRTVSVLLGVVLVVGAGELALRLAGYGRTYFNPLHSFHVRDPNSGYLGKKNFVGRFVRPDFDITVVHDENGFRRQEHQNVETDRTVFVFGDSFTWGWGVDQGRVFTDRMSLRMPEVLLRNYGLNASGTAQQLALFRKHAAHLVEPGDTVLVMFCTNDFSDNVGGALRVEIDGDTVRSLGVRDRGGEKLKDRLKDTSYLFNLLVYTADRLKARSTRRHALDRVTELDDDSPEMTATRHFLKAFRDEVAARGARFVVALIPDNHEYGEGPAGADAEAGRGFRDAFFRCAGSLDLATVDLLPYMKDAATAAGESPLTLPLDGHWNERGHEVVAAALAGLTAPAEAGTP